LDADKAWFKTLPTHYETDVHFFCHAGIQPGKPLHKQTRDELIWIREEFLYTNRIHPKYIVHGHSSVQYVCGMHVSDPEILENRCNLDTGACFWNKSARLTAALFEDGVKKPIQVFQV
jgi:serine/threonine protein phosphatase 1